VSAYGFGDGSTEMQIQWAQSTDYFDVQFNIRYDVYVNGVLEEVRFGSAARSSLTVNSEKTRSKSSPRILPAQIGTGHHHDILLIIERSGRGRPDEAVKSHNGFFEKRFVEHNAPLPPARMSA
jgi:hypothetical protein